MTVSDDPSTGGSDLSGTVELADGQEVEIPRPDKVYPTFCKIPASLDLNIQQDRIRMGETDIETEISLATVAKTIDNDRPIASIFSGVSSIQEDDSYAEISIPTLDEIRELRDACDLILRYHGEETNDLATTGSDHDATPD